MKIHITEVSTGIVDLVPSMAPASSVGAGGRSPLTSPRPRVVVITNVPRPACLALEMMHPGEPNSTPPILLCDGFLPRVALLSRLEALAVLATWQI